MSSPGLISLRFRLVLANYRRFIISNFNWLTEFSTYYRWTFLSKDTIFSSKFWAKIRRNKERNPMHFALITFAQYCKLNWVCELFSSTSAWTARCLLIAPPPKESINPSSARFLHYKLLRRESGFRVRTLSRISSRILSQDFEPGFRVRILSQDPKFSRLFPRYFN